MFDLGIQELVVIFIVALLVFGPKRLPELGKALGKGILELRKAMEGIRDQVHAESEALSRQVEDSVEGAEKKDAALESPPLPPVESPYVPEEEKTGENAETVKRQTDKIVQEERKEDKVDGR